MREDNSALGRTYLYTYNAGGNLVSQNVYLYNATSGYGNYQYSRSYSYGNDWSDQLTSYNGSSISYDNAGNPTSYLGGTMGWTRGRLLSSYKPSGATYTTTCSYNADGIRYRKFTTVSNYVGRTVNYTLNGTTILQETRTTAGPSSSSTDTLKYMYAHTGLVGVVYNGTEYYYLHNLQGDIVAIQNSTGNTVAQYTYDAWGNHTVCDGDGNDISSDGTSIANINPFRYRGYYFATELDLYYLQSRYYDPNTGRFINCDTIDYLDPESINGLNLYAYCLNNPIMYCDPTGHSWESFWRKAAVVTAGIIIAAGAIAVCAATAGAGVVLIGAAVGLSLGMGMSAATQAIFTGEVDFGKVLMDGLVGAISGAIAVTGIGLIGTTVAGGILGGATSIGEDIYDGNEINAGKFFMSVALGAVSGAISGAGANAKALLGKSSVANSYLKTAISASKIAMYKGSIREVNRAITITATRFSASILTASFSSRGLSKLFGW